MKFIRKFFDRLFFSRDPFFNALDQYLEQSQKEVMETLSKPRKKSNFLVEYEKYLGVHK